MFVAKRLLLLERSCIGHKRQEGFTILELMLASTIFAVILLVLAVGVMNVGKDYYKGVTSSKTQSTARSVMAEISQAIEFSTNVIVIPPNSSGVSGLCLDNVLYSFAIGQEVVDSAPNASLHQGYHGLVASSGATCSAGTNPSLPNTGTLPVGSRELLNQFMRLGALTITASSNNVYTIRVKVIYGDDDLLSPPVSGSTNWANEQCSSSAGSQFCAASDLTTTVQQRLL